MTEKNAFDASNGEPQNGNIFIVTIDPMEINCGLAVEELVSNYRPAKTLTRRHIPDDLSLSEFEILIGILMETVNELSISDRDKREFDLLLWNYVNDRIDQSCFLKELLSIARRNGLIDGDVERFLVHRFVL